MLVVQDMLGVGRLWTVNFYVPDVFLEPLLHLVGILFPHIKDDTWSKSHQIYKIQSLVLVSGVMFVALCVKIHWLV